MKTLSLVLVFGVAGLALAADDYVIQLGYYLEEEGNGAGSVREEGGKA